MQNLNSIDLINLICFGFCFWTLYTCAKEIKARKAKDEKRGVHKHWWEY